MSSTRSERNPVAWTLADVDVNDVARSLERGEKHPGVIPEPDYEVAETGLMFWLSASGRIHQTWITTLTCADPGKSYSPLMAFGNMGSNPSVAGGMVLEGPAWGWGCGVPWQVPW